MRSGSITWPPRTRKLHSLSLKQPQSRSESEHSAGPFLSHGDLNDENIIVRDGKVVGVLGWDTFGWYPRFWEFLPLRGL